MRFFALLAVALAGCSTPAEVACLPGQSPCNGTCIDSTAFCGSLPIDMAGSDGNGSPCDGGTCMTSCSGPTDCPATTGTACIANLCDPMAHVCTLVNAPPGVPCNDHGGTVCDGSGACVGGNGPGAPCSSNMQCAFGTCGVSGSGSRCCAQSCAQGPCGATDCDGFGACVWMPKGMFCGIGLCNGNGTCVLPCGQPNYKCAFVTSQTHDGKLGGPFGADGICAGAASAAGVTGTFSAWVSVTGTDANTRIGNSTQPYQLLDGTGVAINTPALSSGSLLGAINRDENGTLIPPGDVWTNTNSDGTLNLGGACGDFDSNSHVAAPASVVGSSGATDGTWTNAHVLFCDSVARLYCIEQ